MRGEFKRRCMCARLISVVGLREVSEQRANETHNKCLLSEGAERGKWRRSRLSSRLHSHRSLARSSKQPTQPTVPCGGEPFRQRRRCIALERDFGQPSAPPQRSGSARQSRSDAAAPLRAASRSSPPAEPGEQGTSLRQRPAKCGCRPRPKSASRQQSSETKHANARQTVSNVESPNSALRDTHLVYNRTQRCNLAFRCAI